jgi:recombination protein RecA
MSNASGNNPNGLDAKALGERAKALDMALAQIDKQYGKGAIMRMGERPQIYFVAIDTGDMSLYMDIVLCGLLLGVLI